MFPESLPECFPEETGVESGIMDAGSRRAHPQSSNKTPPKGSGNKKSYDKNQEKVFYESRSDVCQ